VRTHTPPALHDEGYDGTHDHARVFRPHWFNERDLIAVAGEGHPRDLHHLGPDAYVSARVRQRRKVDTPAGSVQLR